MESLKYIDFDKKFDALKNIPSFGVAGNFTGHLEQAGEARDFVNMKTESANAPKALFPTYIPNKGSAPEFLQVYPFDCEKIIFPKNEEKIQIEPECAILCDLIWENGFVEKVTPQYFFASNDCSIRKDGARKISEKKNWGKSSKGISTHFLKTDNFLPGGIMDGYRIASFLLRDGQIFDYGEDSRVMDYSYFYGQLLDWIKNKLNNQADEGPAENLHEYLTGNKEKGLVTEQNLPSQVLISIGATRYTAFGESNFLKTGDEAVVVVYPESEFSHEELSAYIAKKAALPKTVSCLYQKIVV